MVVDAKVMIAEKGGKGLSFRLVKPLTLIGRSASQADIVLYDTTVSNLHCGIRQVGDSFIVFDLSSHNGVYIGKKRVQKEALHDRDVIKLGETFLQFRISGNNTNDKK